MMQALVIAYGNPLRGDDGLAWAVAEKLRTIMPKSARLLCVQQLSPELADSISKTRIVLFVDATAEGNAGDVHCETVTPSAEPTRFWHHIGPGEVLALARELYAASPHGFLLTVHGEQFNYGYVLSAAARDAIPQAVDEVRSLLARNGIACAEIAA